MLQLEYEIQTLRSVLAVKTRDANELKRKLGITPMSEFKDDLRHGMQTVRESDAYASLKLITVNYLLLATFSGVRTYIWSFW